MGKHKDILDISVVYGITVTIGPFPTGFPVEIIPLLVITVLGSVGVNPVGLQYGYSPSSNTALLFFFVSPEDFSKLSPLAFFPEIIGNSLCSQPFFKDSNISPDFTVPPFTYNIQADLLFSFCKSPSQQLILRLVEFLSTFGTINYFPLLGKELVVQFSTPSDGNNPAGWVDSLFQNPKKTIFSFLDGKKAKPVNKMLYF